MDSKHKDITLMVGFKSKLAILTIYEGIFIHKRMKFPSIIIQISVNLIVFPNFYKRKGIFTNCCQDWCFKATFDTRQSWKGRHQLGIGYNN